MPVHYGTFWPVGMSGVRQHMFAGPGPEFARLAAKTSPQTTVRVLTQGESLTIGSDA